METFDFETPVNRVGTHCVKWDIAPDVLPMWVADMDFRAAPCIVHALEERVRHGVFGYTQVPDSYYRSLMGWFSRRHGWEIDRDWILYTSGVVPALSAVIKALTEPGDKVIFQTPAYNCFFSSVRNNGCELLASPLREVATPDGGITFRMDLDDLERKCADPKARVFVLCNPHNPVGRVWTPEELAAAGAICRRYGIPVISDEIHCEVVMPGYRYTPFASTNPENRQNCVTLYSLSKGFNIAGLQIADIITENPQWRERIDRAININEVCDVNPFGVIATEAAYAPAPDGGAGEGERWLAGMNRQVESNYRYLRAEFTRRMPACRVTKLEGTYLVWVKLPGGRTSAQVEEELKKVEKVWVNPGSLYGQEGYIRINVACPPVLLKEGVGRILTGLARLFPAG